MHISQIISVTLASLALSGIALAQPACQQYYQNNNSCRPDNGNSHGYRAGYTAQNQQPQWNNYRPQAPMPMNNHYALPNTIYFNSNNAYGYGNSNNHCRPNANNWNNNKHHHNDHHHNNGHHR